MRLWIFLWACGFAAAAAAADLRHIGQELLAGECIAGKCTYEVLLPTLPDPVEYTVGFRSRATDNDTLSVCDYIIEWKLPSPAGVSEGFSAYFGGDHYRFSGRRLQEYHSDRDMQSMAPGGDSYRGVQNQAQFVDLLPQNLGRLFVAMSGDSAYSYDISPVRSAGRDCLRIKGVRRVAGYDAQEFSYVLAADTYAPMEMELENNPGQVGEQTVTVRFSMSDTAADCDFTLEALMKRQSEAFEKFRDSSFSLEELVGEPLPEIALPTGNGGHYVHHRGEAMPATTVLVFLESGLGSASEVVQAVRDAIAMVPSAAEVVWLFSDRRVDDVAPLVGRELPGETTVLNSGEALRDCGVGQVMPVIIFVGADGKVCDFIRGANRDLRADVIQKVTLASAG
jgi:hypothetical protein